MSVYWFIGVKTVIIQDLPDEFLASMNFYPVDANSRIWYNKGKERVWVAPSHSTTALKAVGLQVSLKE